MINMQKEQTMSREKQIEEMANTYYEAMLKARGSLGSMNEGAPKWYAKAFYEAGYRKQSEGEWIEHIEKPYWLEDDVEVFYECSVCKTQSPAPTNYCPNCGAKMKGGAE